MNREHEVTARMDASAHPLLDFSENPVIAHRGGSGYAPENTLAAFDRAYAQGAQWVEFDVMLSADQQPVVIHDDVLNRTTNGQGPVNQATFAELQQLDAGSWFAKQFQGEKIPHFREVLKWLIFSNVQANIEIKVTPETAEETAVVVLNYLQRYWPTDRPLPLVSSFEWDALMVCRSLVPELPLGYLLHTWDDNWQQYTDALACTSIHVHHRLLTRERVAAMKAQGLSVLSYTVNRQRLAKKLLSWGVDAVFSDYPDLLSTD